MGAHFSKHHPSPSKIKKDFLISMGRIDNEEKNSLSPKVPSGIDHFCLISNGLSEEIFYWKTKHIFILIFSTPKCELLDYHFWIHMFSAQKFMTIKLDPFAIKCIERLVNYSKYFLSGPELMKNIYELYQKQFDSKFQEDFQVPKSKYVSTFNPISDYRNSYFDFATHEQPEDGRPNPKYQFDFQDIGTYARNRVENQSTEESSCYPFIPEGSEISGWELSEGSSSLSSVFPGVSELSEFRGWNKSGSFSEKSSVFGFVSEGSQKSNWDKSYYSSSKSSVFPGVSEQTEKSGWGDTGITSESSSVFEKVEFGTPSSNWDKSNSASYS